jgi:hypothetical protein
MFEYFPGNYVWNLGVVATLNSGGTIDEVDRACRPLRELAAQGSDVGTAQFMAAWRTVADQLEQQAGEAEKAGHLRTAGRKYFRASVYVSQAERMQSAKDAGRNDEYQRSVDLLVRSLELLDPATTKVEVPYVEDGVETSLPAYFCNASRDGTPAPVMILWNGLDSTKEMMVGSGFHREMAARGISTLMVDCPGSGEALRLRGLTARVDTEVWAAACVDWLEARDDIRLVAGRLLRASSGGVREAARALRRVGRQPRLGCGAEAPPRAGGRAPGAALLGPRPLGLGRDGPRPLPREGRAGAPRRGGRADQRAVPHRPR